MDRQQIGEILDVPKARFKAGLNTRRVASRDQF